MGRHQVWRSCGCCGAGEGAEGFGSIPGHGKGAQGRAWQPALPASERAQAMAPREQPKAVPPTCCLPMGAQIEEAGARDSAQGLPPGRAAGLHCAGEGASVRCAHRGSHLLMVGEAGRCLGGLLPGGWWTWRCSEQRAPASGGCSGQGANGFQAAAPVAQGAARVVVQASTDMPRWRHMPARHQGAIAATANKNMAVPPAVAPAAQDGGPSGPCHQSAVAPGRRLPFAHLWSGACRAKA